MIDQTSILGHLSLSHVGWIRPSWMAKELGTDFNELQAELARMVDAGLVSRRRRYRKAELEYCLQGREGHADRYAGWSPADGPFPGVFSAMPPGHRCLWTMRFIDRTGHPVIHPSAPPPEEMSLELARLELQDHAANNLGNAAAWLGRLAIEPVPFHVLAEARRYIVELRTVAAECIDPTGLVPPPGAAMLRNKSLRKLWRDGWEAWYHAGEE